MLLALISLGVERGYRPALGSLLVVGTVENLVFPLMPLWAAKFAPRWLGLAYAACLALAVAFALYRLIRSCWRNVPISPLGLAALALSIISASAYLLVDVVPLGRNRLEELLSPQSDVGMMIAIAGSGIALLLALFSLAIEKRRLPAVAALSILAAVETLMLPLMPFWTIMLARWGMGLLYAVSLLTALILDFGRLLRLRRTGAHQAP